MNLEKLEELRDLLEGTFEEDVKRMTPKDRLGVYLNLMEFFVPKMNRSNFQVQDNDEKEIKIFYYGPKDNEELQGTLDRAKED